jgi:hypothetical protein
MTKEEKHKLIPLFGYAYFMKNRKKSSKYDETSTKEFLEALKTDKNLAEEIANAAKDETTKHEVV